MIKIAIVGDIGSGKSHIAKLFNYPIFNADLEVAKIYKNNEECSRKLRNDDPDMYDKYLYNRKKKDDKCDNILQLNNDLEKQYDKILDDKSDLNPLSMLFFGAGDENTYEIIMSTATYIFLFCITLLISFYIVRIMVSLLVPAASATNILVNPKDTFNKMKSAVSSPK